MIKLSIGRHFGTAERTFSRLACVSHPPYGHIIFIKLQKSTFKPTFYQQVLPEYVLQNFYPQNFALDPWRHLLRYEPGDWVQDRPARDLRGRKVWRKNSDGKGSVNRAEVFRFGAIFAGIGNIISISIFRIVGLVGGHLWAKREARC